MPLVLVVCPVCSSGTGPDIKLLRKGKKDGSVGLPHGTLLGSLEWKNDYRILVPTKMASWPLAPWGREDCHELYNSCHQTQWPKPPAAHSWSWSCVPLHRQNNLEMNPGKNIAPSLNYPSRGVTQQHPKDSHLLFSKTLKKGTASMLLRAWGNGQQQYRR